MNFLLLGEVMSEVEASQSYIDHADEVSGRVYRVMRAKNRGRIRCFEVVDGRLMPRTTSREFPSGELFLFLSRMGAQLFPPMPSLSAQDPTMNGTFLPSNIDSCAYCDGLNR